MRLVFQRIVAVSIALWGVVLLLAHPFLASVPQHLGGEWGALCIAGCYSLFSAQPIRGRLRLLHVGPTVAIAFSLALVQPAVGQCGCVGATCSRRPAMAESCDSG